MLQAGMLIPRYDLSSEWNLRGIFLRHFSWYDRIPPSCDSGFYSPPFAILILLLTQTSNQTPSTRLRHQHTIGTADSTHIVSYARGLWMQHKNSISSALIWCFFFFLSPLCFELNAYLPTYLLTVYPLWYYVNIFQLLGKKNKKRKEKENPINNR